MKQYYACPAHTINVAGRTVYRPMLAHAADSNGGCWKVCEQDHEGRDGRVPTHFLVAVNDRLDPSLVSNPSVWTAVNAIVGARLLAGDFPTAQATARTLYGDARADRMLDQITGGE